MDAGKQLDVTLEHRGERAGGGLAPGPVGVGQEVQRGFEVQGIVLARDREHEPRHRLVEQPVPGGGPHDGLVVQELLHLVGQLVGTHRAHPVEHGTVARKIRIGGEQARKVGVVEPVEFEREEHQRRREGGDAILRVGHELGAVAVHRVLIVAQPRKGHQPSGGDVDLFVGQHAGQQRRRVETGQPALIAGSELGAGGFEPAHVARHFGGIGGGVEIAQIPVGQLAEAARGGVGIEEGTGQGQGHG